MEIKGAVYNITRWEDSVKKGKRPLRNKPCPCGSGTKYKKCCKANEEYTTKAINKKDVGRIGSVNTPVVADFV